MDKAKIVKEPLEAQLPEKAWVKGTQLHFNIHEFNKDWCQRTDRREMFELSWIKEAVMKFGPRSGFKGLVIDLTDLDGHSFYKISKTHKELAKEIAILLIQHGKKVVKKVI